MLWVQSKACIAGQKEQNGTKSIKNPIYGTAKVDNKSTARDKAPPKAERQEHLWRTVK
jgi:hypothetical protein